MAPIAAGTTAAHLGTCRPPRYGTQRGKTSPQRAIRPIAVKARSPEAIESDGT
ncbi:hypothetical protein H0E86_02275 [Streptomyces sp. SCSIO-PteL053]|nr:hypothetical protein H0E86_02275 [Streptomyces sp. SCSIO-PteL053]